MVIDMPVEAVAAQTFSIQLGDKKYKFDIQWNDRGQYFTASIADDVTLESLADGLALVLGVDILDDYNFGIGSIVVVDTANGGQEATPDNFGARVKMYWYSPDEKNAILQ